MNPVSWSDLQFAAFIWVAMQGLALAYLLFSLKVNTEAAPVRLLLRIAAAGAFVISMHFADVVFRALR